MDESNYLQAVRQTGIPFELINIDPAFSDTAAFCERYHYPLEQSVNTIIVASKSAPKRYAACVVQATRRLDVNHAVKEHMNAGKLSFATPDETKALTGMMLGGVTAFGLPPSLPIYIDAPLMTLDRIVLGGGSRAVKIKIAPEALKHLPNATVATISL